MNKGPHAVMWSGGKDSALALRRALASGIEVGCLLNFHDPATGRVRFHATKVAMIEAQARALGIPLRSVGAPWEEFDAQFSAVLRGLVSEGYRGVVFGDIHLADVRGWYEERVRRAGLDHIEPIWGTSPQALLDEFVGAGGRAVLTCVDTTRLAESWLGRVIDADFAREIGRTGIDPCGENGEYHSFAFTGPPFAGPVAWTAGERRSEDRFVQLDVLPG